MKDLENVLKALADINRMRIVKLLSCRVMCVCELAYVLGITQPSVSRHLKKLKRAGLIKDMQDGFWTNYCIDKTSSGYTKAFLKCLNVWLADDRIVRCDAQKAKRAQRTTLCCR
ncbi:MAG: metalloregulator ArsR/SmtB family transcription factor [Candidatus Omnitrophica bacterium]|nr:metalloregulator ArsR/SmtB family transcription factor [Candidatus Omnitrophota bacterium]